MEKESLTRVPVQARAVDKRMRIVAAGRRLFAKRGYDRTNSKEIAALAGVSIGTFYAYFPDKAELFLHLAETFYAEVFALMQRTMEGLENESDPGGRAGGARPVRELVRLLYQAHDIEPALHREISLMVLKGGTAPKPDEGQAEGADDRLAARIAVMVQRMDKVVQAWLAQVFVRMGLNLTSHEADLKASLVFRSAEEIIHRLRMQPDTLGAPAEVLGELETLLIRYLGLSPDAHPAAGFTGER